MDAKPKEVRYYFSWIFIVRNSKELILTSIKALKHHLDCRKSHLNQIIKKDNKKDKSLIKDRYHKVQ